MPNLFKNNKKIDFSDFPDSKAAVDDLKACLDKIDLRVFLIKSIKDVLEKRLLHPGVNTKDILTGYVAAIKTIRHLDNSGVLLETISEPVKQYMRSRPDTVRCVVSSLTEDSPTYLAEELAQTKVFAENAANNVDDWDTWMPDPIDASTSNQADLSTFNCWSGNLLSHIDAFRAAKSANPVARHHFHGR